MMFFAALIIAVACATNSPSATVTVQTPTHVEHGTILAPCELSIEGNYERLVKLMGRDDARVTEIPPIPNTKVK